MSLKINEVISVLRANQIPSANLRKIVTDLESAEENKKTAKEPGAKKQFVLITSYAAAGVPETGFAVQIEESEDTANTLDKIRAAARAYNQTRKGQKMPVRTISESLSALPAKILVENGIWRKTKEPVRTLSIADNNNI